MKFRRRIKTLAVAGLAFGAACTDSPTVPQSVETEGAEALFFNSNRALAALASESEPRDYDDLAEFPETVAGLDFGECLVEYRRADDHVTAIVVQVLGVGEERNTDPFMVRYRTKKGRFLYSATCDVPEDARDAAMDRISWAPGHGENAAGKGWNRNRDDAERGERQGTSSLSRDSGVVGLVIGTRLAPLDEIRVMSIVWANYSQYDWCNVLFDGSGNAIAVLDCGMNVNPGDGGCDGSFTFDAFADKCLPSGGGGSSTTPTTTTETLEDHGVTEVISPVIVDCDPLTDPTCVLRYKADMTPAEKNKITDAIQFIASRCDYLRTGPDGLQNRWNSDRISLYETRSVSSWTGSAKYGQTGRVTRNIHLWSGYNSVAGDNVNWTRTLAHEAMHLNPTWGGPSHKAGFWDEANRCSGAG